MPEPVQTDIDDLRQCLDGAFADIVDQALYGLALCGETPADLEATRAAFSRILEACSAHDLAGQRLTRIQSAMSGTPDHRPDAHLLNGPATGVGPSQAEIDALFEDTGQPG